MKKLLYLLTGALVLMGAACAENTDSASAEVSTDSPTAVNAHKGFFYVLDATGRHLRSGHLPKDPADEQWLLELQAETTSAEILHIWLDRDFVTVEL